MAIEWTAEIEEAFIEGIIEGTSIEQIALSQGISARSFYRHRVDNKEFDATIARAQEISQDREVDGFIAISDQATPENYNAVKTKIWTRMWVAGKRAPKKYGDKVQQEVSGPGGAPIQAQITVEFVKPKQE